MTRLQKKCLIAAAGTHFLLVVAVFCTGFFKPTPKVDDSQVLDVIPDKAIDQALQSGVRNAQPPPPTPPTPTPPPPQPQQEPPKPVVEPPKPVEPTPPPKPEEPVVTKPEEPIEPKPKPQPHKVEVNLKPIVRKTTTETDNSQNEAKEIARREKERRDRINRIVHNIQSHSSSSTTIEMPEGTSTVAYANYAVIVRTVYTQAWNLPSTAASDESNVKASVTIARDGHVIESHIVEKCGDSTVDRSVQDTLDRVSQIRPFPDDSTDKERTYIINFNLKAKRGLE